MKVWGLIGFFKRCYVLGLGFYDWKKRNDWKKDKNVESIDAVDFGVSVFLGVFIYYFIFLGGLKGREDIVFCVLKKFGLFFIC